MPNNQDDFNNLVSDIQSYKFIPFVGLGASTYIRDYEDERKTIIQRIRILKRDASDDVNRYLDSLAVSHGITLPEVGSDTDVVLQWNSKNVDQKEIIQGLCKRLAELGAKLVGVFGEQMVHYRTCVANRDDYQVPLPPQGELQELYQIFVNVLSSAKSLKESVQEKLCTECAPPLLADPIYKSLLILAYRVCERLIKEDTTKYGIFAIHNRQISELKGTAAMEQQSTIRLDELAWLEDLLWHILRFDIPIHLNSDELMFRLSLDPKIEDLRRGDLPQVAEFQHMGRTLANYKFAIKQIKDFLIFVQKNNNNIPEFHQVLAAVLWYEYEAYKKRADDLATPGPEENALDADISLPLPPLVITTNYDNLIENALEQLHMNYEVVFPVWNFPKGSPTNNQNPPAWYVITNSIDEVGNYYKSSPIECSKQHQAEIRFNGPIVVKLHGSPLEKLPENTKITEFQHAIILSESDLLTSVVRRSQSEAVYPIWLEDLLTDDRYGWWFLGYSSDDWFVHLKIYKYLSYLDLPTRVARALAENFDPVRSAFLDTQKVRKIPSDLDQVTKTIKLKIKPIREILEQKRREAQR